MKQRKWLLPSLWMTILIIILIVPIRMVSANERETVKVGFFPFEGYHVENAKGIKSGYGYDILQKMLTYENWKYQYVGYKENISWADAQKLLDQGKIDLLTSATKDEERLKKYDYSENPIGQSSTMLTVKAGDGRFDTADYKSWNHLRVGMIANNSRNKSFASYAKEHGFSYEKKEYDTPDQLEKELKNGNVDMIVTSNLLALSGVQIVDKFDEKPFYVIVKKGNKQLLAQVNDALERIKDNDASFADELYDKYYAAKTDGVITFTKAEENYINQCKTKGKVFTAVINTDRKPLSYLSKKQYKGLLVDISKTIFKRSGLKVKFIGSENRNKYMKEIKSQRPDFICDFSGTDSMAEEYGYVLTGSYYNSSRAMLVRKGYDGSGKICALTKGSITDSEIAKEKNVKFIYFDSNKECQQAVRDGKADFTYSYTRAVQDVVYSDVKNSLACITVPDMSVDFRMAINLKDSNLLTSIIGKSVDSIEEKDISYLSEPYTYYNQKHTSFLSFVYDYPVVVIVFVALGFLVVLVTMSLINGKKLELRGQREKEKLQKALAETAAANEAKTAFLSRMSHELRTPINAIKGYNALMKDNARDSNFNKEKVMEIARESDLATDYLLAIISDLLDIQAIEEGKITLVEEEVQTDEYMKNILHMIQHAIEEKKIDFSYERITQISKYYLFDGIRFQQVLLNVLYNAIKFTPKNGSISLTVGAVEHDDEMTTMEFKITDTGIGMSQEFVKEKLFQKFEQERHDLTSPYDGCGTGLAISKLLLDKMGGSITCDSKLGEGTTFKILVSAKQIQKKRRKRNRNRIEKNYDLSGIRVLMCEDNEINQDIECRLLERMNCEVDVAEDGFVGTEMFQNSEEGYYDIVLMDIRMPVMDGLEATRVIRSMNREDVKTIPIVAVSANAFDEDVEKSLEAGMNEHVAKPIGSKILYDKISFYCKKKVNRK